MIPIQHFENYLINEKGVVVNSNKGNILTPSLNENGYLYVTLWKENQQYTRSLHRLVAQTFVPNPELKPIVNHKDANRANPFKDNLEWMTQSENIKYAYQLGTMTQKRKLLDCQLQDALLRFLDGESMTVLAEEFDHGLSRLSINLRNLAVTTQQVEMFTAELIRQKRFRNTAANAPKKTPVQQITLEGILVQIHESLTAAAVALGKSTNGPISNALNGRQTTAYGFVWKYV